MDRSLGVPAGCDARIDPGCSTRRVLSPSIDGREGQSRGINQRLAMMIKALAPRLSWGCSWVWLAIVLVGGLPLEVGAQAQTSGKKAAGTAGSSGSNPAEAKKSTAAPPDANRAATKEQAQAGAPEPALPPDPSQTKKVVPLEYFRDHRAEKALANTFPQLPGSFPPKSVIDAVKNMAMGQANIERAPIERYVNGWASELTNRNNIKALIDPQEGMSPNAPTARGIETATNNLLEPILRARAANNTAFLDVYNKVLVATLPRLLNNHLMARIEAMIVLAQSASGDAVEIFVDQLRKSDQTVWVKLWAARGLANVTQNGRNELDVQRAIKAGKALVEFLANEEDIPWPAQMRALEALGSLRQPTQSPLQGKAEMAAIALQILADPESKLAVRAAAAWALGMMRVGREIANYNFPLVTYHIGAAAAEVGEKMGAVFSNSADQAEYLTGLLVTQLYPALNGIADVRESGLLNMPGGQATRGLIEQARDLVGAVATAAVQLDRAAGTQISQRKRELSERVAALRMFLDKNRPADSRLTPGSPEVRAPEVAKAPGG
jgi:hypothetical protein